MSDERVKVRIVGRGIPCPTTGCGGDSRYAAPGRGHIDGCRYPLDLDPGLGDPVERSGDTFYVAMVSPWNEVARWRKVDVDTADRVFEILGPPDVPFVKNEAEEGGDG